jgi:hypothetical protein
LILGDSLDADSLAASQAGSKAGAVSHAGAYEFAGQNLRELMLAWAAQQAVLEAWRQFQALYGIPEIQPRRGSKPSKPRWGQPGRNRRRKNRQAARALEAMMRQAKRIAGGGHV